MPFLRTDYQQHAYTSEQLQQISEGLMQALQEHFQVPDNDYFQVFHAHESEQLMYDNSYLNVERSERLLYIQITLGSGRSVEQKRAFYKRAAELLEQQAGVRKQDVFIVLLETELHDWSFGNGEAQMIDRSSSKFSTQQEASTSDYIEKKKTPTPIQQPTQTPTQAAPDSDVQQVYGELAPDFARYSEDVLFGDLWRSPELSPRERSLLTIAALVAGRHSGQLPYHINLARQNGWNDKELAAAMTHLAFYAGWPAAAAGLLVLKEQA
jgi:alkylhydroperoxidase/carboxymuconolactone decarboxylase family protein YurZ/phenylpyruvate tautomerase PptA (4-oxalocrotonate tautomerase family)